MGQIIGSSTTRGEEPNSNPVTPNDLRATFFKFLGVPLDLKYIDPTGRPQSIVGNGQPVKSLWG